MSKTHTTTLTVLLTLIFSFSANIVQSAPLQKAIDTQLIRIQFAVLHSTSPKALESEAWASTDEERDLALNELLSFHNENDGTDQNANLTSSPNELLQTLAPLIARGRFKLLVSTQWTQPTSKQNHTQMIKSAVNSFGDYDLIFGNIRFEERSTFLARLSLKLVEFNALSLKQNTKQETALTLDATASNPLNAALSTDFDIDVESITSNQPYRNPIIVIEQQRQVSLNQIHYFDHPVTPAFLLVSRVKPN